MAQPKPVRHVSVVHDAGEFHVVLTNNLNQSIRTFSNKSVKETLTVAADYSDFLGVMLLPFRYAGKVLTPVRAETYSDAREKTFDEYHAAYRADNGSLNWNKLMHYEWARLRSNYKNKMEFRNWVLPHPVKVVLTEEQRESARNWLSGNATGTWMMVEGGYRFQNDRDAVVFKLYFHGSE